MSSTREKVDARRPFFVGGWCVEPNLNRISRGSDVVSLQPKVMNLLLALCERPGTAIDRDELLQQVWPGQIVTDSSLYQAIANLRKALQDNGDERRYVASVSSRGYRLIAPLRQAKQDDPNTSSSVGGWIIAASIIVLIAITWILMTSDSGQEHTPILDAETHAITSIVLMPWDHEDDSTQPWAGALNDAVLSQLMRVEDLQVIVGDSVASERWQQYDAMLRSRVLSQDNRVRAYLQLLRTEDQALLWAGQFEGTLDQLFKLQDDIVAALLQTIGRSLENNVFDANTIAPNVFADYLLGRVLWADRSQHGLAQSEQIFESVIEKAPNFAPAYVGLCDSYFFSSVYRDWTLGQALQACSPLLERALLLHPDLGEALATKALFLAEQGERDIAKALFERAIENAPSYAFARLWYGNLLRSNGELSKAQWQHEQALRLAPYSPIVRRNLAYGLLNQGKVSEARRAFREALDIEPNYSHRPVEELEFFDLNVDRAIAFIQWSRQFPEHYQRDPNLKLNMATVQLALGNLDQAQALIANAESQDTTNPSFLLYLMAISSIVKGDDEGALNWFRQRMKLGANEQHYALPYIAALHHNGRIDEALRLVETHIPRLAANDVQIDRDNHYQLMGYVALLRANGQHERAEQLAIEIDQFLDARLDIEDINHLEWLAARGRQVEAGQHAMGQMHAGWLPSYNAEPYSAQRMQALLAVDHATFTTLLNQNRQRVLNATNN